MIDLTSPDGRVVHLMIMEKPVNGVIGIVECAECDAYSALLCTHTTPSRDNECNTDHAKEVEQFLNGHTCFVDETKEVT